MTAPVTINAEAARNALRQVKDPELDMNIIDLGLVYDVEIVEGEVRVKMTLTSPGCPAGPMITNDAYRVRSEEHTSELQSRLHLVCRLLLEKKKKQKKTSTNP